MGRPSKYDPFVQIILQYVRENPGKKGSEINKHFRAQDIPSNTISSTLNRLQNQGLIENHGNAGPNTKWYPFVEPEPIEPEFVEMAEQLMDELRNLLPSERKHYLARRLQELFLDLDQIFNLD